ncbi:MAG: 6-carboxytetrahydropterin synthase QueD [Candidatus Altiarchaeota archaeon]
MRVGRIFYFDSAHHLPDYKGECEKQHGHTYRLEVVIEGELKDNMVMDFKDLKKTVEDEVLAELDHMDLNDIFENPTAENLMEWIFDRLGKKLPLHSVKLWEGRDKWVEKRSA